MGAAWARRQHHQRTDQAEQAPLSSDSGSVQLESLTMQPCFSTSNPQHITVTICGFRNVWNKQSEGFNKHWQVLKKLELNS